MKTIYWKTEKQKFKEKLKDINYKLYSSFKKE